MDLFEYDENGTPRPLSPGAVFNNLAVAPVLQALPDGEKAYVVVTLIGADGNPRIALMNPRVIVPRTEVEEIAGPMGESIEQLQESIESLAPMDALAAIELLVGQVQALAQQARDAAAQAVQDADAAQGDASSARATATSADTKAGTAITAASENERSFEFPQQTLSYTAGVAVGAGYRPISVSGIPGVKQTDKLLSFPVNALPAGFALFGNPRCTTVNAANGTGTVEFQVFHPALVLNQTFSIPVRLVGMRPRGQA